MARSVTRNEFTGGLNQDQAQVRYSNKNYFNAVNMRITTDDNNSASGSLSSVKGTELDFKIPDVNNVLKLIVTDAFAESNLTGASKFFALQLGFNQSAPLLSVSYATTSISILYDTIAAFINTSTNYSTAIIAQASDSGVIIHTSDFSTITQFQTPEADTSLTEVAPATRNLEVIGSAVIRDVTILFTAPKSYNGTGQIWKLTRDNKRVPTLTLIRHREDDFSLNTPIEALGRYEIGSVQKVYWTDNNNPLRFINIESETAFSDVINSTPSVAYDIPIAQSIDQSGGSLDTGIYQYAYRLRVLNGPSTSFSRFSAPIVIVEDNEDDNSTGANNWVKQKGVGSAIETTKSLNFTIDNIDTNFTHIDIVCAYQDSVDGNADYFLIEEVDDLQGSTEYSFIHDGNGVYGIITDAEVTIPEVSFTTCKTITIKDNRLLAGNVKDTFIDVDSFNAEATRFRSDGITTTALLFLIT